MTPARRRALRILLFCSVLVATSRPATADWQFTPFFGFTFKGNTTLLDLERATGNTHWNFGGVVRLIGRSPIGVEGYFVYTPGFFNRGNLTITPCIPAGCITHSRSYALMGNVVLTAPLSWNEYGLRPFVSGGFGLLHASATDPNNVTSFTRYVGAYNIGGGAVGFLSDRTGVRFDFRYISNLHNVDDPLAVTTGLHLRYMTLGVGVVFKY